MGVKGLEKFLEHHAECIQPVNLERLALAYRAKHNNSMKIIIDSNSCLNYMIMEKPWVSGYQLKLICYKIENLVERIQSIGIKVTCFFGEDISPAKMYCWAKKQAEKGACVKKFYKKMKNVQMPNIEYQKMHSASLKKVILDIFKEHRCQILYSKTGCHSEAAAYAKKYNYAAVLAQDSDFVIYNCAEFYLSMKHMNLEKLETVCYRTDKLAELLDIIPEQLPMLATVMGNRIIHVGLLKRFQKSLFKKEEKYSRNDAFFKVANFIKVNVIKNCMDLKTLACIIFNTSDKDYLLQNSLDIYNAISRKVNLINDLDAPKWIEFKMAVEIFRNAGKLFPSLHQIIFKFQYILQVDMTDPDKKNYQIWFEMAQKLRRRIYGVLFLNKPERDVHVREIHVDFKEGKQEKYVEPIYPEMEVDLIKLWIDKNDIYIQEKWNLFFCALKIPRNTLLMKDLKLFVPVTALKYILMDQHIKIADWELKAVLASILLVQHYSVEKLEAIPVFQLDPDGIHLYWCLLQIFDLISILNSVCGYPLNSGLASPVHYQDGQLFNYKYIEAKNNASFQHLCESKLEVIHLGNEIMAMICE